MEEKPRNQDDAWRIGQTVQIIAGPFVGFEGVIYRLNQKERVAGVKIDFLTKPSYVEVPLSSLQAPEPEQ